MHRHQSAEIEQVVAEIEEMKVGEKDVIYNYDTMYSSPWATHIDFEARHRKITEVPKILDNLKSCSKTCFVDVFVVFCKSFRGVQTLCWQNFAHY